jgi:hypothetical protein
MTVVVLTHQKMPSCTFLFQENFKKAKEQNRLRFSSPARVRNRINEEITGASRVVEADVSAHM